jgi:hypothetical protein
LRTALSSSIIAVFIIGCILFTPTQQAGVRGNVTRAVPEHAVEQLDPLLLYSVKGIVNTAKNFGPPATRL